MDINEKPDSFFDSLPNAVELPEQHNAEENSEKQDALDEKPTKKESKWGVIYFEAILAVIFAIIFVFTATFMPAVSAEYKEDAKNAAAQDFDFSIALYELIKSVFPQQGGAGGEENTTRTLPADASLQQVVYTGYIIFPLETDRRVTSEFGFRTHPISGQTNDFHKGVDIAAAKGTKILAVANGKVAESTQNSAYGNYILLDHGNDFYTLYAHCDKLFVEKGMVIRQGETIAAVGTTGNSTGYHLHFAMKKDGKFFNPIYVFPEELNAQI